MITNNNMDSISRMCVYALIICTQIIRFMGPTWGPPGSCWPQMRPMLAPWTAIRVAIIFQIYGFRIQATEPTTKARQKQTVEMHNRELMTWKLMWALSYQNKLSTAGSILLTWINFNQNIDKELHAQLSVKWNYLSIPELHSLHHWSLGMDK